MYSLYYTQCNLLVDRFVFYFLFVLCILFCFHVRFLFSQPVRSRLDCNRVQSRMPRYQHHLTMTAHTWSLMLARPKVRDGVRR